MTAVKIEGLDSLQRRLKSAARMDAAGSALRKEAEAIAAAAKASLEGAGGKGELAKAIEIIDESRPGEPRYAIGTRHQAGWHVEHGTARMQGRPWLAPAVRAALPAINHALRKMLAEAVKALGRA